MDEGLVQYYVAPRAEHPDGTLALLAAHAALLGQERWTDRAEYRRWRTIMMTKVVLEALPAELIRIGEATEALALRADGGEVAPGEPPDLLVLPPQSRAMAAPLLGHLRLAAKRNGRAPEPAAGPVLVLVAAGDLGMHGGKLAAQAAHAALLAQAACGHRPAWAVWTAAGAPLALRRAASDALAPLAARYPGGAVHDAGHTQVAAGALTVVAVPPDAPEGERLLRELAPW